MPIKQNGQSISKLGKCCLYCKRSGPEPQTSLNEHLFCAEHHATCWPYGGKLWRGHRRYWRLSDYHSVLRQRVLWWGESRRESRKDHEEDREDIPGSRAVRAKDWGYQKVGSCSRNVERCYLGKIWGMLGAEGGQEKKGLGCLIKCNNEPNFGRVSEVTTAQHLNNNNNIMWFSSSLKKIRKFTLVNVTRAVSFDYCGFSPRRNF